MPSLLPTGSGTSTINVLPYLQEHGQVEEDPTEVSARSREIAMRVVRGGNNTLASSDPW